MNADLIDKALPYLGMHYFRGEKTIYTCHALRYALFEHHYGRAPESHAETSPAHAVELARELEELMNAYFDFTAAKHGNRVPSWWSDDTQTEETFKLRTENLLAYQSHLKGN
jgi:hypothetical protein